MNLRNMILDTFTINMLQLDVIKEKKCCQNCFYNPESNEDIHLAHIEPPIGSPEPIADPHTNDLFWCGLH